MENFDLVKLIENVACELLENYRSRQATLVESRILEEGGPGVTYVCYTHKLSAWVFEVWTGLLFGSPHLFQL